MQKTITLELVLSYMQEFVNSTYNSVSGWHPNEYAAAQEDAKHWLDMLKKVKPQPPGGAEL